MWIVGGRGGGRDVSGEYCEVVDAGSVFDES